MTDEKKRRDPRIGVVTHDRGRTAGLPVCGVRMRKELWDVAKVKAEAAGTTRNAAIVRLIEGWTNGTIELPEVER